MSSLSHGLACSSSAPAHGSQILAVLTAGRAEIHAYCTQSDAELLGWKSLKSPLGCMSPVMGSHLQLPSLGVTPPMVKAPFSEWKQELGCPGHRKEGRRGMQALGVSSTFYSKTDNPGTGLSQGSGSPSNQAGPKAYCHLVHASPTTTTLKPLLTGT